MLVSGLAPWLQGGRSRECGKPGIEDLQLIFWRIEKHNAHADARMDVDNASFGREAASIAGDLQPEHGSHRKRV